MSESLTLERAVEAMARALLALRPGITPTLEDAQLYAQVGGTTLYEVVMHEARAALAALVKQMQRPDDLHIAANIAEGWTWDSAEVVALLRVLAEAAE